MSWKWVRWGGLAAILSGVLYAVQSLPLLIPTMFDPRVMNEKVLDSFGDYLGEGFLWATSAVGLIFLVGLLVLHTGRGSQSYGRLGRTGFFAAFIGALLLILKTSLIVVIGGALGSQSVLDIRGFIEGLFLAGALLQMLGVLLLGIATLRARVLPGWFGWALIAPWLLRRR